MKNYRKTWCHLILLFNLLLFSGCGLLLGAARADREFFVLNDLGREGGATAPHVPLHILVRETKANRFINSHKIIFSENPSVRGYYQLAQWVEPPPERLTLLLIQRLRSSSTFNAVSRIASSTVGDIQLNTEIIEFYHDIKEMPGEVVVKINAEIIDLRNRSIISEKLFEKSEKVDSYSAQGATEAFSRALTELISQIERWSAEQAKSL